MSNENGKDAQVQEAQTKRLVQVSTPGQTQTSVLFTSAQRVTPAHQSNVSSTGPRLVSVAPHAASSSSSSSVLVVAAKVPAPGLCTTGQPLRFTRPAPAVSVGTPATVHGRTVVMAVPRTTVPQPLAPRPPYTTSSSPTQLPANFQIPPGMVLIRSNSGQLMLVSQQTLAQAQAQQAQKVATSVPAPRLSATQPPAPMVTAAPAKTADKLMLIRVAGPPGHAKTTTTAAAAAAVQKTTGLSREATKPVLVQPLSTVAPPRAQVAPPPAQVAPPRAQVAPPPAQVAPPPTQVAPPRAQAAIKETTGAAKPTFTITQETLENVKKCKNFLVTLIKLASSGTQSPDMATNVKALVRSLLDGSLEPEEFTNKLYIQLKSTPQPYLVPFLKKSLPVVRHLTTDPQHFIQQAAQSRPPQASTFKPLPTPTTTTKPPAPSTGSQQTLKHVDKSTRGVPFGPAVTGTHLTPGSSQGSSTTPRGVVVLSGQQRPGVFSFKRPSVPPQPTPTYAYRDTSYKEDDDINDVAFMAGVNVKEESVSILASGGGAGVGSVVHSCHDPPFLSPGALHARILRTGEALGVSEARPDVVTLVSHATQEFLRDLLEKLTMAAEHRETSLKQDLHHTQVSDVRSQLHFLEQVEAAKKRRQEEEEREALLRLARRRCHSEDLQRQQLWQRAKELQLVEQAQLQHRETNITALAAIGPRKRRPLDATGNVVSVLARGGPRQVRRVTMRDLVLCMEEDRRMRHSLTLYKVLMR